MLYRYYRQRIAIPRSHVALRIEILNSNGQQFHQYKQSEQTPLISSNYTQKQTTYDVRKPSSLHLSM
jgi:hypothetical protein